MGDYDPGYDYVLVLFFIHPVYQTGAGQLGIADLLLITLISEASQNAMAGEYDSITEGFMLVGVLVFWEYAIIWLSFRSIFFSKMGDPEPVLLVKNGVLQRQNMKKELITSSELMGMLREQGVDDVKDFKTCYIEGSGNVSVIQK